MTKSPRMLMADQSGKILDNPRLLMLASRNGKNFVPSPEDLLPLPAESELFLLPQRRALGFNPRTNKIEALNYTAVAAFASPAYTLSAHPAYETLRGAPALPLFAYGAVGYANGRFWLCARKVDQEPRQVFSNILPEQIELGCEKLLEAWPQNRLLRHVIDNCVRKYSCPAAKNFALGRYEAPLPSSRRCDAHCIACISEPQKGTPFSITPQCRLAFTPRPEELAEMMFIHESREKNHPIYSFGQGCEGDPLMNADLLAESIALFRKELPYERGHGTINCNTNASLPEAIELLAAKGLSSIRVSLNSSQAQLYEAYYRPSGYDFNDVINSIRIARKKDLYVSLNLLFFPGITDNQKELESLIELCSRNGVSMIQWRNLNVDPEWYRTYMEEHIALSKSSPSLGLKIFMEKLKKACPWLDYGYFNPWLGTKARIKAPEIS